MTGTGLAAGRILESCLGVDYLLSHFLITSLHIFEPQFPHFHNGPDSAYTSPGKSNEKVCVS